MLAALDLPLESLLGFSAGKCEAREPSGMLQPFLLYQSSMQVFQFEREGYITS